MSSDEPQRVGLCRAGFNPLNDENEFKPDFLKDCTIRISGYPTKLYQAYS